MVSVENWCRSLSQSCHHSGGAKCHGWSRSWGPGAGGRVPELGLDELASWGVEAAGVSDSGRVLT